MTASSIDVNIPRFNQGIVAAVTGLAFVVQQPWLVAVMFLVLAVSWRWGPAGAPLTQLYVRAIRPRFQPNGPTEYEDARPPRFAQLLGAVFLGSASLAFLAGLSVVGWALTLVVTVLAALAASTRICVGCLIYQRVSQ